MIGWTLIGSNCRYAILNQTLFLIIVYPKQKQISTIYTKNLSVFLSRIEKVFCECYNLQNHWFYVFWLLYIILVLYFFTLYNIEKISLYI